MVAGREVEAAAASPQRRTSTLPVSSVPTGTLASRQVRHAPSAARCSSGWIASSRSADGFELVADAADLGHRLGWRPRPCALSWPICLRQAVAARLQFLGAGLDRLALGLQRAGSARRRGRAAASCARLETRRRRASRSLRSRLMSSMDAGAHAPEMRARRLQDSAWPIRSAARRRRRAGQRRRPSTGCPAPWAAGTGPSRRRPACCAPTPRRARAGARSPAAPGCRAPRRRR